MIQIEKYWILLACLLFTGNSKALLLDKNPSCMPKIEEINWMQSIVDGWSLVLSNTAIKKSQFPRIVLFTEKCTFNIAATESHGDSKFSSSMSLNYFGDKVSVLFNENNTKIALPNNKSIPVAVISSAFLYDAGSKAFFIMAMPSLWLKNPQIARDKHLKIRILGAALHELIHTQQLPYLMNKLGTLGELYTLPKNLNDDVIEIRFRNIDGYKNIYDKEVSLLYEAVFEPNLELKMALIVDALKIKRTRRKKYFTGENRVFQELEAIFLNMEGIGEWVRFKFHQLDARWPNEKKHILQFIRGRNNLWSQDEGLAICLLLDELLPNWKAQLINSDMISPFALLEKIVKNTSE